MFTHKTFSDGSTWSPQKGVLALALGLTGWGAIEATKYGSKKLYHKIKQKTSGTD